MMRFLPILVGGIVVIALVATLRANVSTNPYTQPKPNVVTSSSAVQPSTYGQTPPVVGTRPMMGQESFGLAVCDEVPKTLVEGIVGKPIVETKDRSDNDTTSCTYIMNKDTKENIVIVVAYLDPEVQRTYFESNGKQIKADPRIEMNHFYVYDEPSGQIGGIYLLMATNKYVRVERSSPKALGNEESLALARRVAQIIMTGK